MGRNADTEARRPGSAEPRKRSSASGVIVGSGIGPPSQRAVRIAGRPDRVKPTGGPARVGQCSARMRSGDAGREVVVGERLRGKVAVVTGGASGIGEGIVRRAVAEGAACVIADLQEERAAVLAAE